MSDRSLRIGRYALGLIPFAALAIARLSVFAEGDTFWGARTGQQIVADHSVHLHDVLSWTRAGTPWHPNEWGYDVVLWLAYRLDGIAGFQLLVAATVMLLGVAVIASVRAFDGSLRDTYWVALFCGPLILPWLSARAQTVSYSMQLLELLLLVKLFTARDRAVWIWAVSLLGLQVIWVNLHEAALGGVAIAAGSAAVRGLSLLRGGLTKRSAGRLLAAPAILLVGSLATPFGWSIFADSEHTRTASAGFIVEWSSIWHATAGEAVAAVVGFLLLAAVGHVWHRNRGTALEAVTDVWLGAALVLAAASIFAVRFIAPLLLVDIVATVAAVSTTPISAFAARYRALLTIGATAIALALTVFGIHELTLPGEPTSGDFPSAALVTAIPADCQLLNEYGDGGWISLERWPAVKVSQDGRNDLYGRALLHREASLLDGHEGMPGLMDFGVTCVLAKPTSGISDDLARDPRWTLLARDSQRVLYVLKTAISSQR